MTIATVDGTQATENKQPCFPARKTGRAEKKERSRERTDMMSTPSPTKNAALAS
jgi:hypothetical protein